MTAGDDYALGAFLLYAAWLSGRDPGQGRRFLAGAWSFTCLATLGRPDKGGE